MDPKTIKIACPEMDNGYIIINEDDFDPEEHVKIVDETEAAVAGEPEAGDPAPKARKKVS